MMESSGSVDRDVEMENGDAGPSYTWQDTYLPDLEEMAISGNMSADWDTLRHIIKCRLSSNITQYLHSPLAPRPPVRYQPSLAPTQSTDSFLSETDHTTTTFDNKPSTPGGLVLAPWPPKAPRARNGMTVGLTGMTVPVPMQRMAGGGQQQIQTQVMDFVVDEDAAIGGKTLKASLDEGEAKETRDKLFKMLDGFDDEPPFTLQRVCELALHPLASHKSIGKYLRALERILLVTSSWEAAPDPPPSGAPFALTGSTSIQAQTPSTPLFSPIPFLIRNGSVEPVSFGPNGETYRPAMGGTPSPLLLPAGLPSDQDPQPQQSSSQSTSLANNGTTEHLTPLALAPTAVSLAALTSGDPSNDPFVGRVDELDAGPLTTTTPSIFSTGDSRALHSESGNHADGTGESGNMTPHGISDTPQAISSTTSFPSSPITPNAGKVEETSPRKLAPLPRSSSVGSLHDRFVKAEVSEPVKEDGEVGLGQAVPVEEPTEMVKEEGVKKEEGTDGIVAKVRKLD